MSKAKKLTRAEKQQINAAIQNARRQDKRHKSAQDSIPFQRMFPDGICRVTDHYYTKTVQFQDINYQLNQNEDKAAIFDGWCDFLNYFDSSVRFELSFINTAANKDTYSERIAIPLKGDSYDSIRAEYTQMLKNQLAKGNNGLIKTKYLTFGIEADSLKNARLRLERIETDVLNNFKRLGVQADPMNGKQRLELLHGIFHMDEQQPFLFDWDWLAPTGLSVKDFIAPSSFSFRNGKNFTMGRKIGQVSFLQILAPELNDRMLADFLDMQSSLIVTICRSRTPRWWRASTNGRISSEEMSSRENTALKSLPRLPSRRKSSRKSSTRIRSFPCWMRTGKSLRRKRPSRFPCTSR